MMMTAQEITDRLRPLSRGSQKKEIVQWPTGLAAKIIVDVQARFPGDDLLYLLRDRRAEDSPLPR
jgi:hypothetical protein